MGRCQYSPDVMSDFLPKKREHGLKVEVFQGETLVYDLDRHTAHCLNGIAASVWQHADGGTSIAGIASRIAADTGTAVDEDLVLRAIAELDKASLLDTPIEAVADPSRRAMFQRIAWAAAIPLVLSVAVPTPAFAASTASGQ